MLQKNHATVGIQLALAMLVPAKGKSATEAGSRLAKKEQSSENQESVTAPPHLTGRWDFSRLFAVAADPDVVHDAEESAEEANHVVKDAWQLTVEAAKMTDQQKNDEQQQSADASDSGKFVPAPMTHEELRLWLQSFNAGPYALLKYKGDVPYKETREYAPKVLKYYEQDLSSKYDPYIEKAAAKYGLDPQLIRAIMKTESSFRNDTVSHAGARGLMQVMPIVWKDIKEKYNLDWEYSTGVFEPEKNIEVASAYLAWLRYDFLPRHFEAYDRHPDAPTILVRDHDRGVPDRKTPRVIAASDETTKRGVEVASAGEVKDLTDTSKSTATDTKEKAESTAKKIKGETAAVKEKVKSTAAKTETAKPESKTDNDSKKKAVADSGKKQPTEEQKAPVRGKVEITDARTDKTAAKSTSNGKTRVVMRGGNGSKVTVSVAKGKVSPSAEKAKRKGAGDSKRPEVASAVSKTRAEEDQGG